MPELKEYIEDPDELERYAHEEAQDRQEGIDDAWDYYNGVHKKPLKVRQGQPDDNIIVNMIQRVVDQSVSMLMGEAPAFEVDMAGDAPEEEALAILWDANRKDITLHNFAMSGALAGHVFVKLVPDDRRGVRFILTNPRFVSVFWQPDDIDVITAYKIQWSGGDTDYRQDLVNEGTAWRVRDMQRPRQSRRWQIEEYYWPFDFPPLVDWQNLPEPEEYYGRSDLFAARLNDSLNFIASNTGRIIKHHAHPKTIGTGLRATDLQDSAIDSFWTVPNADAKIYNLEMESELASSMAFMNWVRESFYAQHRAVDLSAMKDKIGQLTNFGLRVLFKDALDKLQTKQRLYGEGLAEMCRRSLIVLGQAAPPEVTVVWSDPLPYNDLDEIQAVREELDLGIISKQTAAGIRGRNWALEQERKADEAVGEDDIGTRLLAAFERGA